MSEEEEHRALEEMLQLRSDLKAMARIKGETVHEM